MWADGLKRSITLWGYIGAGALGVIVLAHSAYWLMREIALWADFRQGD